MAEANNLEETMVILADAAEHQKDVTSDLYAVTSWVTRHSVGLYATGINSERAERVSNVFNLLHARSKEFADLLERSQAELEGLRAP